MQEENGGKKDRKAARSDAEGVGMYSKIAVLCRALAQLGQERAVAFTA